MKQPFVGFKLDDVTSFQLDLFAVCFRSYSLPPTNDLV